MAKKRKQRKAAGGKPGAVKPDRRRGDAVAAAGGDDDDGNDGDGDDDDDGGGGEQQQLSAGERKEAYRQLVRHCAIVVGRLEKNLKAYIGNAVSNRQLEALGEEGTVRVCVCAWQHTGELDLVQCAQF